MDDLKKAKEAFEKMTPGDAATALIAGSAGFLIDAGLNPIGFLTATETGFIEESDKRCQALARRIKNDLEFFESGVITADDLKASVDEAIKAFRDYVEDS